MPVLFVRGGGMAHVSDEDYEAASKVMWATWEMHPSGRPAAWVRLQRAHRRFDLFLHRMVAVRMDPLLANRQFTVTPVDGDYLNCRRENLETNIRGRRPGPARKASAGKSRERYINFGPDGELAARWRPVIAAQGR